MAEDVRVPAGWYPDPLGLPQLRWWDNHAWTEYTSDARQPMVAETVTQQARLAYADDDEDGMTRRERREREREAGSFDEFEAETFGAEESAATSTDGVLDDTEAAKPAAETLLELEAPVKEEVVEEELSPAAKFADFVPSNAPTTPAYHLETRFDDLLGDTLSTSSFGFPALQDEQPAAAAAPLATAEPPVPAATTSTAGAWIMAMIPLLALVVTMFFLLADLADSLSGFAPVVVLGLPYLAGILLAYLDWAALKKKGFTHLAHWAWAFASPPAYLIARFIGLVRTTGRGYGPILTMILLAGVNVLAIGAVPGLIIAMAPPTFSAQVEDSVENQAKAFGADITVDCPSQPPTIVGQTFTCLAQTTSDDPVQWGIIVSLQRSNIWYEWQVKDWGIFTLGTTD